MSSSKFLPASLLGASLGFAAGMIAKAVSYRRQEDDKIIAELNDETLLLKQRVKWAEQEYVDVRNACLDYARTDRPKEPVTYYDFMLDESIRAVARFHSVRAYVTRQIDILNEEKQPFGPDEAAYYEALVRVLKDSHEDAIATAKKHEARVNGG